MDERVRKLAYNLVNYSMEVKPGDKVYIQYVGEPTEELARQLVKEVYEAGGLPFPHYNPQRVLREVLLSCTKEQLELYMCTMSYSLFSFENQNILLL